MAERTPSRTGLVATLVEASGLLPLSVVIVVWPEPGALLLLPALASAWYVVLGRWKRILDDEDRPAVPWRGVLGIGSSLGLLLLAVLVVAVSGFALGLSEGDRSWLLGTPDRLRIAACLGVMFGGPLLVILHRALELSRPIRGKREV